MTRHNHPVIHVKTACGCVVPDVAAVVAAVTPVATAFAVVPEKAVAAVAVAVTNVAMALAVVQGRPVVTAPVVIVATAVTTKYVAIRAKNVVRIQALIAAILMKLAVKAIVVTPTKCVAMARAIQPAGRRS